MATPSDKHVIRNTVKRACIFLAWCSLCVGGSAQTIVRLDHSRIRGKDLDQQVRHLMDAAKVTGLALAIFNNNRLVYQQTYGYGRAASRTLILPSTNFYGASLSKAVFAVLVMKLVEDGVLDLDKPLQSYLPKAVFDYTPSTRWQDHYEALKGDTLYQRLTARMCLDHTTGFPNWRWDEPDQQLRIKQVPGSRYSYSGEGFVYLQFVIEKMLHTTLEQLMQKNIFGPAHMINSSYSWQPRFEKDYVLGHDAQGKPYDKDKDNEPRSASTLETTVDDYSHFLEAILQDRLISKLSTRQMFTPQIAIRSVKQMGPLRLKDTTANDAIQLGYGLGWGLFQSPNGTGAFKEGHGDGFQHYSILFPNEGTGVLILSNGDNTESIFKELLRLTIADNYTPWYWENYIPLVIK